MVAALMTRVMFSAFTYIIIVHCQTRFDLLFSVIMNCVTYSVLYKNPTCSISTRLNGPGKIQKMVINGPGKSWKTHIKRSWKTTFSVLYAPWSRHVTLHPSKDWQHNRPVFSALNSVFCAARLLTD